MPMIKQCAAPGCTILTMGPLCVAHERELAPVVQRTPLPVGRPVPRIAAS
jgi:hypothetical protein